MISRVFDTAELLRIAWSIRLRFKGRYWRWRMDTAFGGPGPKPSNAETRHAAFEFAAWRRRMRTMR